MSRQNVRRGGGAVRRYIDHRSADPREFQIASFTLGFIVAHKSRSFLPHAGKTATAREARGGRNYSWLADNRRCDNFLPSSLGIPVARARARRRRSLAAKIVLAQRLTSGFSVQVLALARGSFSTLSPAHSLPFSLSFSLPLPTRRP